MKNENGDKIMPKIVLDDLEYNSEDLSEKGLAQLASLQFVEQQLTKLRNEIAVHQTAQRSYAGALKAEIEELGIDPVGDADDE